MSEASFVVHLSVLIQLMPCGLTENHIMAKDTLLINEHCDTCISGYTVSGKRSQRSIV